MDHDEPLRGSPVIRSDFTAPDNAWLAVRDILAEPSEPEGFMANVTFVDSGEFEHVSIGTVIERFGGSSRGANEAGCAFIVDARTMNEAGQPVLVVGLGAVEGQTFRVAAKSVHIVENNLTVGNRDFREYRASALRKASGVYGL